MAARSGECDRQSLGHGIGRESSPGTCKRNLPISCREAAFGIAERKSIDFAVIMVLRPEDNLALGKSRRRSATPTSVTLV